MPEEPNILLTERPDDPTLAAQLRTPTGDLGRRVAHAMNRTNLFITELTYDLMDIQPSDRILEIGFGNGNFLPRLTDRAAFVAGIDISEDMIAEAAANNPKAVASGKLELRHASIAAIPYPDKSFDKVCTINTLYFWPDPMRELAEIRRILKPNGSITIAIRTRETLSQVGFSQYNFTLYSRPELLSLLKEAGFTVLGIAQKEEPVPPFDALIVRAAP